MNNSKTLRITSVPDFIKDLTWCPILISKENVRKYVEENNISDEITIRDTKIKLTNLLSSNVTNYQLFLIFQYLLKEKYDIYEFSNKHNKNKNLIKMSFECDGRYNFVVKNATFAKMVVGDHLISFETKGDGTFVLPDFTKENPLISMQYHNCYVKSDGELSYQVIMFELQKRKEMINKNVYNLIPSLDILIPLG